MKNPFSYRPESKPVGDGQEPDEWADNWLSNGLAFASQVITPHYCETPEHWTSRITNYLFTSCPCCLLLRGMTIGACVGAVLSVFVMALFLV